MTAPKIAVQIGTREFLHWPGEVEITRSLDNFSTVTMSAPFEPEEPVFRETFVPFSYKSLKVLVDDQLLFTGQLIGVEPRSDAKSRTVRCSGYSLPAVLGDTTMPKSEFPIEYGDRTLLQIAIHLAEPFGITVVTEAGTEMGPKFKRVRIKPTEKVGAFLVKLAKARGLIMRDTALGELMFLNSAEPGQAVVAFKEGETPTTSVAATFSPQSYYSEITGFATMKAGRRGSGYTEKNDHLPEVVRPLNFTIGDVNAGDLPGAVRAHMARMFGNMVAYVVKVPTWHDPSGTLWEPNTTATLHAPGAMVYNETELLVRDVILKATQASVTASIGLVLPGAFNGEQPESLPWQ
jgi:prophage tail gpP-like protein